MKKSSLLLIPTMLLCLSLLVGCGAKDGGNQGGSGQLPGSSLPSISLPNSSLADGTEESKSEPGLAIFADAKTKEKMEILSTQFYRDEVIEIKRVKKSNGDLVDTQDIYLCKENGDSRMIVQDAPAEYGGKWYYTEEGYCLAIWKNILVRIESDGTETFNEIIESGVVDICQLSDGRIMMIMTESSGNLKLAELDPETGEFKKIDGIELTKDKRQYIAAGENGLLFVNSTGFWDVNLETGEMTSTATWDNYEYTLAYGVQDLKMYAGGVVDVLTNLQKDRFLPKNINEYRTTIALWIEYAHSLLKQFVEDFNKESLTYYVELHTLEDAASSESYYAQVESALIDGIGLDIVADGVVSDLYNKIKRGAFEDLTTYMEQSDVYKENYFPGTFEYADGEKIYGVAMHARSAGLVIKKDILGEETEPDVETLVDALLNHTGGEILYSSWDSVDVLEYFLYGSEDLWGMVDWKKGTCDFNGVLFAKMLEAAKIYGNGGVSGQPALAELMPTGFYDDFYTQEQLDANGMIYVGYIFDDGCYANAIGGDYLLINSNASNENKAGAWEFFDFILSEDEQATMPWAWIPTNRAAYDAAAAREIEQTAVYAEPTYEGSRKVYKRGAKGTMSDSDYRATYSLTEYKAEEMKDMLDASKNFPLRTSAIWRIMREEAAAYFDGTSYADDVCNNIQKRVQQYLDEEVGS